MDSSQAKKIYNEKLDKLLNQRHQFSSSLQFTHRLTEFYSNEIINSVNDELMDIAILAYGGLGRQDIAPYSDIDILFIVEDPNSKKDIISKIITALWDKGMKISHTVKEINQIREIAQNDIISFCQFLELRYLIGSKKLTNKFLEQLNEIIVSEKNLIIDTLISDIEKRYSLTNSSPFLLEPNIKNNPGTLRDFHTAYWLYTLIKGNFTLIDSFQPLAETFLTDLLKSKYITKDEYNALLESLDYLIKLRNELHITYNTKMDRLDFSAQLKLSKSLIFLFQNTGNIQEKLMDSYFISAEQIFNLLHRIKKTSLETHSENSNNDVHYLADDFLLKGRFLSISENKKLNLREILQAYLYRLNFNSLFADSLRNLIVESIKDYDGLNFVDVDAYQLFRQIIQSNEDISEILFHMNRTNVLGTIIPEFEDLQRFFQPNAYHVFTADEHTLVAIKNLYKLKFEDSLLGDIFRRYPNKEILIMAIICHDIAKPHTLEGHELLGSQICESIMERLGFDDDEIKTASFLVKNHLTLEQVAFRRNINDISTLDTFREKFSSLRHLDYLYLLTYADLSAVNPSSWTSWKNSLLDELYFFTSQMITEDISAETLLENHSNKLKHSFDASNKKDLIEHLELINDPHYFYTFDEKEISQHVKDIKSGKELSIFHSNDNNFTKLTIITYDKIGLLAKICGAIAISDISIHDAQIFTRKDNIIIDNFNVLSFTDKKPLDQYQIDTASSNITKSIFSTLDLETSFREHREKWKRIEKKHQAPFKLEVTFEEHPIYTIIDIYTNDKIGLLYIITKKFEELNLSIYFAKIGTKLNGVFDSFYVLDKSQRKLNRSQYLEIQNHLKQSLLDIGV